LEDLEGLSDDEDIVMSTSWYTEEKNKTEPEEVVVAAESTAGMSARQRNAAKRKAKKIAKEATAKRGKQAASSTGAPKSKGRNMKTVITDQPQTSSKVVLESVVDHEKPYDETCWPFQYICEQLCCDLFKYSASSPLEVRLDFLILMSRCQCELGNTSRCRCWPQGNF